VAPVVACAAGARLAVSWDPLGGRLALAGPRRPEPVMTIARTAAEVLNGHVTLAVGVD
jgi:hypothetical protein